MDKDKDIEEKNVSEELEAQAQIAVQETESAQACLPEDSGKKKQKSFPAKKLPGILKKNYKANRIEKKLFKKIYVSSDKTLVQSLFEENPKKPGCLYIPRDKMIEKIDFKRLKLIAKDLKRQKGSFKLVPFLAVAILIVLAYFAVITFKNPLAKKGFTFIMQKAFGARTDISWVNVQFMRATITIGKLQQANKKSPMKNLFQIEKIEISFNLTELLRGKFDARNIEVSGLALDTDRTYSGELPQEPKKENKPNPQVEAMLAEINQRKDAAIIAAQKSIEAAFAEYNPVNVIANVRENLKSPEVAKETQIQVEEAIERWNAKPDELKNQVETFADSTNAFIKQVDSITRTDFSKMKNPVEIQNFGTQIKTSIEQVNSLINQSKEMTNSVQGVVEDVKTDALKIKDISWQVTNALKYDTALVKNQLDKITSFNLDTGTKILSNALDSAMYAMVGSYYPYLVQGVNYAMELKAKSSNSSKEDQKKAALLQPRHERLSGTNIYWKYDSVPKFLIENIHFSGLGISARGIQISSDMDKRGAPATVTASYQQGETRMHKAQVLVDARTKTTNPLVGVEYSSNNYPLGFSMPYLNLDSSTIIAGTIAVKKTGAVSIGGELNMVHLALTADEFEPAIAYRFYTSALSAIDSLLVGVEINLDDSHRLALKISSDLDERFNTILKTVVNRELKVLISEAQAQLTKFLNEQCGDVMDKISEFVNIEDLINEQGINMEGINKTLNEKRGELEAKLREQTAAALGEVRDQATSAAKDAIGDALKNSGIPTIPGMSSGNSSANSGAENSESANEKNSSKEDAAQKAIGGALKGLLKK